MSEERIMMGGPFIPVVPDEDLSSKICLIPVRCRGELGIVSKEFNKIDLRMRINEFIDSELIRFSMHTRPNEVRVFPHLKGCPVKFESMEGNSFEVFSLKVGEILEPAEISHNYVTYQRRARIFFFPTERKDLRPVELRAVFRFFYDQLTKRDQQILKSYWDLLGAFQLDKEQSFSDGTIINTIHKFERELGEFK